MKAKDVIVGRVHLMGYDQVLVKAALQCTEHKEPSFVFVIENRHTGEELEVHAKQLGSVESKREQAMAASTLMQPHRKMLEKCAAPQRERQRQKAIERGYAPPKEEWAMHAVSEFKHLICEKRTKHIEFGHILELDMARHFESCHIAWALEPDYFKLPSGKGFRPDFYLPEIDLYVELTQDDVEAKKRSKLNGMADGHPGVRVIALDGDQIRALLKLDRERILEELERCAKDEQDHAKSHRSRHAQPVDR